jgi:hypothetical protein
MSDQKEGTWRVVQPNGREYLVHTAAKARIAMNCDYEVTLILDDAAQICEQVAAQSNNHLFRSGAKICAGEIRRAGEQAQTDRIAELERERDHWKANHDQQVERARVLMERTDMPMERTRAYQHMRTLQRLVDVQKMLLEAFTGQLERPAGEDPFKDETGKAFDASCERLREAYCVQQPLPVPDQMALVWRADIGRLRSDWIHKRAYFDENVGPSRKVYQAIRDYHYALDTREHGGLAQNHAFNKICQALDMHWVQGAELAKRRAEAASGQSNQTSNEG